MDAPVSIRSLKRFAQTGTSKRRHLPEPFPVTQTQKIAVVGAGPADSAALILEEDGLPRHGVRGPSGSGGMMGWPYDFAFPRKYREGIRQSRPEGWISTTARSNVNRTVDDLKKEGYDAVFISAGAQPARSWESLEKSRGSKGSLWAELPERRQGGKRIQVESGPPSLAAANTAMDSARTCLRLGVRAVDVYYRRTREEMPVTDSEYREAV